MLSSLLFFFPVRVGINVIFWKAVLISHNFVNMCVITNKAKFLSNLEKDTSKLSLDIFQPSLKVFFLYFLFSFFFSLTLLPIAAKDLFFYHSLQRLSVFVITSIDTSNMSFSLNLQRYSHANRCDLTAIVLYLICFMLIFLGIH